MSIFNKDEGEMEWPLPKNLSICEIWRSLKRSNLSDI